MVKKPTRRLTDIELEHRVKVKAEKKAATIEATRTERDIALQLREDKIASTIPKYNASIAKLNHDLTTLHLPTQSLTSALQEINDLFPGAVVISQHLNNQYRPQSYTMRKQSIQSCKVSEVLNAIQAVR